MLRVKTSFIRKVAISGLIMGAAFVITTPSFSSAHATIVTTEDGVEVIFTGISKEALHIRKGASVEYDSAAILPKGTFVEGKIYEVEKTEKNPYDQWVKVKHGEVEGYVAKEFLEEINPDQEKKETKVVSKSYTSQKEVKSQVAASNKRQAPPVAEEQAPVEEAPVVKEEAPVVESQEPVEEKAPQEKAPQTEAIEQTPPEEVRVSGKEETYEEPVQEAPVAAQPVAEEVAAVEETYETPVQEAPVEEEVYEEPVVETPSEETPQAPAEEVAEAPVQEAPVQETPAPEQAPQNEERGSYTTTMEATAYTATGNRTATGTVPKRGTVAVDPDVIPLGTEMYIEGYGNGVAEDTGGAVKGNIIDLYMDSEQEALEWGRRPVNVTIYNY